MDVYFILLLYYGIIVRLFVTSNICSYSENADPICCEGWTKNVYGDCVKSECSHECGYGRCVGLNICECFDGTTKSDTCPYPNQKSCQNNCSNRGKCQDWKCVCDFGYGGPDCNTTLISTCYVKVNRGLCKSTPDGLQLTREKCCSIFQMAWGNPCQFCKERNYCAKGFVMNENVCEDIDECRLNGICLNGQCINERGSFRCECPHQYKLNESTMACQPVKEICEVFGSTCGLYGRCVPLITGEYRCICKEPYKSSQDGKECIKRRQYNVCKMYDTLCQPHGECQPFGMSYICKCQNGFIQSHDKKSCRINLSQSNTNNEDLCRNSEVAQKCINGQCISNADTYKCVCYEPYKPSLDSQECILSRMTLPMVNSYCSRQEYYSQCHGGECIDTYNGYYCKCSSGYISSDNGQKCLRYEENGNDGRNSELSNIYCRNTVYFKRCNGGQCIGDVTYGFKCLCLPGYIAAIDGRSCNPVKTDPCRNNGNKCNPGSCRSAGENDFQCDCPLSLKKSEDGRSCSYNVISTKSISTYCDIPSYKKKCATGQCIPDNYYGFKCICSNGYTATEDGRACLKIILQNSCFNNEYKCRPGRCNSRGEFDYECDCPAYTIRSEDGRSCLLNVITTKSSSSYCDIVSYKERCGTGECVPDDYYGFKCICDTGYRATLDGRGCQKLEIQQSVCTRYQSSCKGGICIERSNEDYECRCGEGYLKSRDGRSCQRKIQSICDTYGSTCLPGVCLPKEDQSYSCICATGYSLTNDGKACEKELSESFCLKFQSNCNGGKCIELRRNDYICECLKGYHRSGDGRSCFKDLKSICDTYGSLCLNGVCYSLGEQDYFCICAMGYTPINNSKACEPKKENSPCNTFGYRCKGSRCIDRKDDYRCECSSGYEISADQRSCEKISKEEKCAEVKSRCRDGFCFDTTPGYICVCSSEYIVSDDGKYCIENERILLKANKVIDFPLLQFSYNKVCTPTINKQCYPGSCVNQNQGYTCVCPHSFMVSDDSKRCNRDPTQCPHCYYGCQGRGLNPKCLCPLDYEDLLNTSLCIKSQKYLEFSISEFQCNAERDKKQTFVITFNGKISEGILSLKSIHRTIPKLIEPKQLKRSKIDFCVPTRKRYNSLKQEEDLISWRVICIFDC